MKLLRRLNHRATCRVAIAVVFFACLPGLAGAAGAPPTVRAVVDRVSQTNYQNLVTNSLYTHQTDNRSIGRTAHDLCARSVFSIMQSYGLQTSYQPFSFRMRRRSYDCWNVVGIKPGLTRPNDIYVIGAHYDSWYNSGADDNATGVAAVLEAARVLSKYRLGATVAFVAFDKEENAHAGSGHFVDMYGAGPIKGMLSVDMVGWNNPDYWNNVFCYCRSPQSDETRYAMQSAVSLYGEGLSWNSGGQRDSSDHQPFESAGISACWVEETLGNPNRHNRGDTVDTPDYLDFAYATKFVRCAVGWLTTSAGLVSESDGKTKVQ